MEFFKAFPIAIIDEDYEGKQASGIGMRQLAEAIEKEGFRVVSWRELCGCHAVSRGVQQRGVLARLCRRR